MALNSVFTLTSSLRLSSFQRTIKKSFERIAPSKLNKQNTCDKQTILSGSQVQLYPKKGGDPAAPSDTATLLRLHPNHLSHLRRLAPYGYPTDFGCYKLSWCDGRCVQGPGTYSPRHADPRLLAIPASCRRVAAYNPN